MIRPGDLQFNDAQAGRRQRLHGLAQSVLGAADDDLPWAVVVGHVNAAGFADFLNQGRVIADDRRHAAFALSAGLIHQAAAFCD